jgi:hypothetical protein
MRFNLYIEPPEKPPPPPPPMEPPEKPLEWDREREDEEPEYVYSAVRFAEFAEETLWSAFPLAVFATVVAFWYFCAFRYSRA